MPLLGVMSGHLWNMKCGNTGFYFCKCLARYKSWWQDPWAQQEDTNGEAHTCFLFSSVLPFIFPLLSFYPLFPIRFSPIYSLFLPLSYFFKQQELWSPSFLGVFRKHVHTWLTAPVLSRHQPYNSCSSGQQQRPPVLMPGRIKWSIIWVT